MKEYELLLNSTLLLALAILVSLGIFNRQPNPTQIEFNPALLRTSDRI